MVSIRERFQRIAQSSVPVLILGETGTGKEVIARLLHAQSVRTHAAFVKLCCPAIPASLLESELFGHEKGSFTGARATKPGRVELADGGTLFLDEIGELEVSLQAKILQLLEDGSFSRIGGQEERRVDLRLISATNLDLRSQNGENSFRRDLWFRINVFSIELPALRERAEDLPMLIDYFVRKYAQEFRRPAVPPSKKLMNLMQQYDWPGNIRELENIVRRYVIMGTEDSIEGELIPHDRETFRVGLDLDTTLSLTETTRLAVKQLERKMILKALQANRWSRTKTAKALKISYRSLLYKMRDARIPPRRKLN